MRFGVNKCTYVFLELTNAIEVKCPGDENDLWKSIEV